MTPEIKNPDRVARGRGSPESLRSIMGDDDLGAEGAAGARQQATDASPQPHSVGAAVTVLHLGKPSHRTAARGVLDALTLGRFEDFLALSVILRARLTPEERRALAWAALRTCDDDEAIMVAHAVIPPEDRPGWPVVPFEDVLEEASFWADHASPGELRAYAVACFVHLPPSEQGAFLDLVQRRTAA